MVSAWRRLEPAPPPPPGRHLDRVVYGLMQPILGGRLLLRDRALLRAALVPVGWLAAFCAAWGLLHLGDGASEMVRHFYQTFAVLAPVPSVLLAAHYARMVVRARTCLGMPPAEPRLQSVWRRCRHALAQVVLIAVAVAPATMLLDQIPLLGSTLVRVTAALWALHWIVVEAFDASRVTEPDAAADQRQPWFVVALSRAGDRVPLVGWVFRRLARFCDWLARPWREDIAVAEAHPLLMLGFGITTAALLATPVLNLFFRPIVLVGAIHVLVQLAVACPPAERGPSSQAATPQTGAGRSGHYCDEGAP